MKIKQAENGLAIHADLHNSKPLKPKVLRWEEVGSENISDDEPEMAEEKPATSIKPISFSS